MGHVQPFVGVFLHPCPSTDVGAWMDGPPILWLSSLKASGSVYESLLIHDLYLQHSLRCPLCKDTITINQWSESQKNYTKMNLHTYHYPFHPPHPTTCRHHHQPSLGPLPFHLILCGCQNRRLQHQQYQIIPLARTVSKMCSKSVHVPL